MSLSAKRLYFYLAFVVGGTVYALGHWAVNIRFQNPALNSLALAFLVFSIPILLLALAWVTPNRLAKAALILIGIASLLPAIFIGLVATLNAIDIIGRGKDSSFEKVSELPQGSKTLRLYVSNCGATCAYGLVLQEEFEIPIGLKLSRTLWSAYHTSDMATLQRLSDIKVRVTQSDGATNEVSLE